MLYRNFAIDKCKRLIVFNSCQREIFYLWVYKSVKLLKIDSTAITPVKNR